MTEHRDKRPEGSLAEPICFGCKHWKKKTDTCKAFPKGIPHEIWGLGDYHSQPFPGDNGIQFELKK